MHERMAKICGRGFALIKKLVSLFKKKQFLKDFIFNTIACKIFFLAADLHF